ncbi:uncharacterized protein LOC117809637 [Notolabrus celidotus]|uniref:uncharacterized protein LOC117809637 n=1 Tax=Notolabrus celidotus TaxID=1203425 RepID=UPI0014904514|nr:uncharacterized protein LOC117809637 [Notolabrus celidotus]
MCVKMQQIDPDSDQAPPRQLQHQAAPDDEGGAVGGQQAAIAFPAAPPGIMVPPIYPPLPDSCLTYSSSSHTRTELKYGFPPPYQNPKGGQDVRADPISSWESHLRNSFLQGMIPAIADQIEHSCITWETGKLHEIEQYAVHAEKLLNDQQKRKSAKQAEQLHLATLTMFQSTFRGGRGGRGRGRGRGVRRGGRGGLNRRFRDPEACFICGEKGHWSRQCPQLEAQYD